MGIPIATLGGFAAGLAAAIKVTRRLHGDPTAGIWGKRLGALAPGPSAVEAPGVTHLRYAVLR